MTNSWKLILTSPQGEKKVYRYPEVKSAVDKAKQFRAKGYEAEVISKSKAYGPTRKAGPRPSSKHYWCPYCIKWRVFRYMAVRRMGILGPEDMRCPVCLISDHNYYIRKYNGLLGTADLEMVYRLEGAMRW
jgi:hypothetical protein